MTSHVGTPIESEWSHDLGAPVSGLTAACGGIVATTDAGTATCLRPDGGVVWRADLPAMILDVLATPIGVLTSVRDPERSVLVALGNDGQIQWTKSEPWNLVHDGLGHTGDALVVRAGRGQRSTYLFLDDATGDVLREVPAFGDDAPDRAGQWLVASARPAVPTDPALYRARLDGTDVSVLGEAPLGSRVVIGDVVVVDTVDAEPEPRLIATDVETGATLWACDAAPCFRLGRSGTQVLAVLAGDPPCVVSIEARTGRETWRRSVEAAEGYALVAGSSAVVVQADDGWFVAHSLADGTPLGRASWRNTAPRGGCLVDGRYVGSFRGEVVAWRITGA